MVEKYDRILTNGQGIYKAVEKACPRDDVRRNNKPDGSWLPKKRTFIPGSNFILEGKRIAEIY